MSFPRYERYKESGVEWLGEVPEGWEVLQGRRLFTQKRESALVDDEQLSATQKYGVIPQKLFMELEDQKVTLALSGLENFKHVEQDDFVISLRSFQGGIERSQYAGCVSPAYTVLRANQAICGSYWAPVLKSSEYIAALQSVTDGIRDGKNISYEQFGQIALPIPTFSEQQTIAAFLDRETGKIDELVAEQERLIELLKEKRQAVISHAVTKGLDPDAPMKDSGIEWLGEVPTHWKAIPMKHLVSLQSGGTPSKERLDYWDGTIPWASAKDIKVEFLADTEDHITKFAIEQNAATLLDVGTVLVVVRGMILARTFPVTVMLERMAINQDLKAIIAGKRLVAEFLAWYLRGTSAESLRRLDEAGHGTKALRMDKWTSLEIVAPPLQEQSAIVAFLGSETAKIDALVSEAQQAIGLLKERRSALISAAVTGKIDVRGVVL